VAPLALHVMTTDLNPPTTHNIRPQHCRTQREPASLSLDVGQPDGLPELDALAEALRDNVGVRALVARHELENGGLEAQLLVTVVQHRLVSVSLSFFSVSLRGGYCDGRVYAVSFPQQKKKTSTWLPSTSAR
jgi:hypothetical protein